MDIVARDLIGTAHTNSSVATNFLHKVLHREAESPTVGELDTIIKYLTQAIGDTLMAKHMLSSHWTETTFVPTWYRPVDVKQL